MNAIYRVVWNALKRTYVAVNEKTGTAQSRGSAVKAAVLAVASSAAFGAAAADAYYLDTYSAEDVYVGSAERVAGVVPEPSENALVLDMAALGVQGIRGSAKRLIVSNDSVFLMTPAEGETLSTGSVTDFYALDGGKLVVNGVSGRIGTAEKAADFYVGAVKGSEAGPGFGSLEINGSDIEVGTIYNGWKVTVATGSTVTADTLKVTDAGGRDDTVFTNKGTFRVGTIMENTAERGANSIINEGTLEAQSFDANSLFKNASGAQADIASLTLRFGTMHDEDAVASENAGRLNVAGALSVEADTAWGASQHFSGKLVNTADGVISVGTSETPGTMSVKGSLENSGSVSVFGTAEVAAQSGLDAANGTFVNKAGSTLTVTGPEALEGPALTVGGTLKNSGSVQVTGGMSVASTGRLEMDEGSELGVTGALKLDGAFVQNGGSITAGDLTIADNASLTLNGAMNLGTGTFKFDKSIDLGENAVINAGMVQGKNLSDVTLGTGKGTVAVDRIFTGTNLNVEKVIITEGGSPARAYGDVKAQKLELKDNASFEVLASDRIGDVKLASGATLKADAWSSTQLNSISADNANLVLKSGQTTVGTFSGTFASVTFKGAGINADFASDDGKWFENTRIYYKDGSGTTRTITQTGTGNTFHLGVDSGLGGTKTYNVAEISYASGNTWITEDGVTLNLGVLNLDRPSVAALALSDDPAPKLITLNNGTLEVSLDQLFNGITRGDAEGTDIGTGETVTVPFGGIQSVGELKAGITDAIATTGEGNIAFTDEGWTVSALNAVTSALTGAYGSESIGTVSFKFAESEAEGDGFTVDTANSVLTEHTNGVIFAETELINKTAESDAAAKLTFGTQDAAQGNTVKGSFGFKSIANATEVDVTDGRTLHLIGSADADIALVRDGNKVTVEMGHLVLGAASGNTKGHLGELVLTGEASDALVRNGTFGITDKLSGNGTLSVAATGTLSLGADVTADERFGGTVENRGIITAAGSLDAKTVLNSATMTAAALTGENITNAENAKITADTLSADNLLVNEGTIESVSMTAEKLSNKGTIKTSGITAHKVFDNTGTIEYAAEGEGTTALLVAEGTEQFRNTGTIKGLDSFTAEIGVTNDGRLEAASVDAAGLTNAGTIESTELDADALKNTGTVRTAVLNAYVSLDNEGTIEFVKNDEVEASAQLTINDDIESFRNKGTIRGLEQLWAETSVTNEGTIEAERIYSSVGAVLTNAEEALVKADTLSTNALKNRGKVEAEEVSVAKLDNVGTIETAVLIPGSEFVNSGTIALVDAADEANAENARRIVVTDATERFSNTGKITGLKAVTVMTDIANAGLIETEALTVEGGTTFTNEAGATLDKVQNARIDGTLDNKGTFNAKEAVLGMTGSIEQSDSAVFNAVKLTLEGSSFDLPSGTFAVGELKFADEDAVKTLNINNGREFAVAEGTLAKTVYNVGTRLTFGSETGLADALAAADRSFASVVSDANGILTVQKTVKFDPDSAVNVGRRPVVLTRALAAPRAAAPSLHAISGSLTIIDAAALEGSAAFDAAAEGLSATIESGAKLAVTRVEHDGDITLLKGFDLSSNLTDGAWTGGWTGENALFVNDGSGLDYEIETRYDDGSFIASLTMADVSTVYGDIAAADIVNAALKRNAEGADVEFLRNTIRNADLSVAEKTKIVNSVTEIGASVGTAANFLADATSLVTTVEEHAAEATGSGLWLKAEGGKYSQDGLKLAGTGEAGYDTTAYGFTFGADGALTQSVRLGAAFSYLKGDADAKGDVLSATNKYDTFGLQGYGIWTPCEAGKLIADIGWFRTSGDVKQTVNAGDVSNASADIDASAVTLGIRAEGTFDVEGFKLTPHVGLRGIYTMNDDFTTKLDGRDAFRNDQDNTFTMQLPIGVGIEKAFDTASGWRLTPKFDITVTPQFGDKDMSTKVTGIGTGVSQSLTTDMAGSVFARTAFGLAAESGNTSFEVRGNMTLGNAGRQDYAFTAGVNYRF